MPILIIGTEYPFIGTDPFSNCKACGRKISYKLSKCPYCAEPDPQLRNALGYRVNYSRNLDPSVTSIWKSTRRLRIRILKILAILTLLTIISTSFVLEYHPNLITIYLGLRVDPSDIWLATLNGIMLILLPISIVVILIPEN